MFSHELLVLLQWLFGDIQKIWTKQFCTSLSIRPWDCRGRCDDFCWEDQDRRLMGFSGWKGVNESANQSEGIVWPKFELGKCVTCYKLSVDSMEASMWDEARASLGQIRKRPWAKVRALNFCGLQDHGMRFRTIFSGFDGGGGLSICFLCLH